MCRIKSDQCGSKIRCLNDDFGIRNYTVLLAILDSKEKIISLNLYLAQYLLLSLKHFKQLISRKLTWLDNLFNHCMNK
jgi:hypothetical protein